MTVFLAHEYLDLSQKRYPEKIAISDSSTRETFGSLYLASNRFANFLKSREIKRRDRVIILLKRSCKAMIAIMGVLKADAIYVPVDPKSPLPRLKMILNDCQPTALVCESTSTDGVNQVLQEFQGIKTIVVSGNRKEGTSSSISGDNVFRREYYWNEIDHESCVEPKYRNIDTDPAYIMYTSGSTGIPKGVTITHLNIINYIEWAVNCFGIKSDDNLLNTAPFHFDMSVFDIYCSMKTGAHLCLAPDSHLLFPNKLMDLMEQEQVTIWKGISSLLMYLATIGSLKESRIPMLRSVLFGGEVLPTKHLIHWMETYPDKKFFNVYGPTEATGISTYYPIEQIPKSAHEVVPIGRPCANTEVLLLKEDQTMAGVNEVGELYIRGSGLSMGYWNDPDKTEKAFVMNPLTKMPHDRTYRSGDLAILRPDGNLEYVGRKDFQVKYMGYRIELYEIEKALMSIPTVNNAAAMLCDSRMSELQELVAFVEMEDEGNSSEILSRLSNILPQYMLPKRLVRMNKIPLSERGKTDREAIRRYYRSISLSL